LFDQLQGDYWNGTDWRPSDKKKYCYNENDIMLVLIDMFYTDSWQNEHLTLQTLDNSSLPYFLTFRDWYDYLHQWDSPYRQDYFYWEHYTAAEDMVQPQNTLSVKAFPNPFNSVVNISCTLKEAGLTTIAIYNLKGEIVKNISSGWLEKGDYSVAWDSKDEQGRHVTCGVYLCRLNTGGNTAVKKLVLLK
jgi:hypothetical protein